MTDNLRAELLGLSAIEPPQRFQGRGPGETLPSYRDYLAQCVRDSAGLWNKVASELDWETAPSSAGGPSDWFPGGTMRLVAACLFREDDIPAALEPGPGGVERISTGALRTRVAQATSVLAEFGLLRQERVLVALPPGLDWLSCVLACAELGLCCVPANPDKGEAHILARATAANCKAAVLPDGFESNIAVATVHAAKLRNGAPSQGHGALPSMHPLLLLSDSAGQMFTIPMAGLLVQAMAAFQALLAPAGQGDIWLATPVNYASTLAMALASLNAGRTIGFIDPAQLNTPSALWRICETCRPDLLAISARTAQAIVETADVPPPESIPLPSLVMVEGEQLEPRCYGALRRTVLGGHSHVVQILGRPEAGGIVAGPQPAVTPIRPSSVSFAAPGLDLSIIDHRAEPSPVGIGGLLALAQATPALALELQGIAPPIALEVKARLDHKGYLWTMGETKVLRQPEETGTGTAELEALIASIEDVEQVAVVRFQDKSGQRSHAFIKPIRPGQFDMEPVTRLVAQKLGAAAGHLTFQVVDRLPYSRSGKLLRSVLRRVATGEPIGLDDAGLVTDPQVVAELTGR